MRETNEIDDGFHLMNPCRWSVYGGLLCPTAIKSCAAKVLPVGLAVCAFSLGVFSRKER